MKTTKFTITVCAVILGAGLLFAEKPTDKKGKSHVTQVIDQLSVDIVLTDSQKIMIGKIDQNIRSKFKNNNGKPAKESYKQSICDFRTSLDSILTDEQKQLLNEKRIERNIEATKKFNPKK